MSITLSPDCQPSRLRGHALSSLLQCSAMSSSSSDRYGVPSEARASPSDGAISGGIIDDENDADDAVAAHKQDNTLLADDPFEQSPSTKLVVSEVSGKNQADIA